mgnify:CR=1 FL=1
MEFRIIKDIGPITSARRGRGSGDRSQLVQAIMELSIEDGIAVPLTSRKTPHALSGYLARLHRTHPEKQFAQRQQPDGKEIWVYRVR